MENPKSGRAVPNQFTVVHDGSVYFQSYKTVIAKVTEGVVLLDHDWDYSRTTSKYLNAFLMTNRKEIEKKIKDGTYKVTSLN